MVRFAPVIIKGKFMITEKVMTRGQLPTCAARVCNRTERLICQRAASPVFDLPVSGVTDTRLGGDYGLWTPRVLFLQYLVVVFVELYLLTGPGNVTVILNSGVVAFLSHIIMT